MPDQRPDEFYIGYLPKAPPGVARRTRVLVIAYLLLSMAAATLIVASMRNPGPGVWEDATPKTFAGVLVKRPYPMLIDDNARALLLVDFGKRGAQQRTASIPEGERITLSGYPLIRDGRIMVELAPEDDALGPGQPGEPVVPAWSDQRVTLRGEIVDSKCFLGAMKPGDGKTHKACAVRCISGGIPPMLVCWDRSGKTTYLLLADERGGPLADWVLPLIGESVEVTGSLGKIGDLHVLKVGGDGVRRL